MPTTKTCTRCGESKPLSEFWKRHRGTSKLRPACKKCMTAQSRRWWLDNPDQVKKLGQRGTVKRRELLQTSPEARARYNARARVTGKAWRDKNRGKVRRYGFFGTIKAKYGLTRDQWDEQLIRQVGRCAICGAAFRGDGEPQVDHDHVTGKVRGMLCQNCNIMLGTSRDNPRILEAGRDYIMSGGVTE